MMIKDIILPTKEAAECTGERFVFHESVSLEMTCEHIHRYMFAALHVEGKKVLDVASGEGYGSHILSQVAESVAGVDIDTASVQAAREKYQAGNLSFVEADCKAMPFEDSRFDVVVSFETIEHIVECESFVAEVKRVLCDDGLFICSSPNKEEYGKNIPHPNEFHLRELTQDEFVSLIDDEFNHTKVLGQSFFIGSAMSVLDSMKASNLAYFRDTGSGAIASDSVMSAPVYTVVLASNALLPEVPENFYEGNYPRTLLSSLQGGIQERDAAFVREQARLEGELAERDKVLVAEQARLEGELAERDKVLVAEQARLEGELAERDKVLVAEQARLEGELAERDKVLVAEQARLEGGLAERDKVLVAEQARLEGELAERDKVLVAEQARLEGELAERDKVLVAEQARLEGELAERDKVLVAEQARLEGELAERDKVLVAEMERMQTELTALHTQNSELQKKNESSAFGQDEVIRERDRFKLYFEQQVEYSEMLKQSLSYLRHMLTVMAGDTVHVRNSLRWKIGTAIIRFLDATQLQFKSPSRLDRMDRTIAEFRTWESNYDRCERRSESIDACDVQCFELWDKPVVSVIIPVYNQYEYTRNCITSIVKSSIKVPYEIIVADDLSTDETLNLSEEFPFVSVVRNDENLGFLKNCNNAATHAEGDYLLFLNNDTQVMDGWLESLYQTMDADLAIAICGSKLVFPDGTLQEAGGILWRDGSAWNYGRGGDPEASQFNYVKEVDYISGASIMVRRLFWDEVGGFDERYVPAYCEDSDLAFEARKHGYKVVYQPKSVVVHFEGKSHGTDETAGLKAYQVTNNEKLVEKWRDVLERDHLPNGQDPVAARERSIGRKRVLYVDHYVPHFDQDAGSKTAFHYLKLLRESGMAVTFLGDNFARLEPYTEVLQQLGIEVLYGVDWFENWEQWFADNSHLFTHVFLNRPHVALKYVEAIRKYSDCKIVYYGHDLHFLREERRALQAEESPDNKEIQKIKEMELSICSQVDVCYYPSDVEVKVIQKELPEVLAKSVPAYIYDTPGGGGKPIQERKGILFVGGFGHPPNIQAVQYFLDDILPHIEASGEDIPFYIVGSKTPDWLNRIGKPNVHVKGFVSEEELVELYGMCRLVVAPLLYGAGVKGKVVEALYYGVPVVTTSIGAEGLCATEAVIVADGDKGFADKIVELHEDLHRIEKLSEGAHQFVQKYFTSKSVWQVLGEDFNI
ncbi:glycosyltransferase [Pseudodesulfovibrio profundus]|nr:glycosyltransferase [Pseudodesulfovibrio profundus]